MVTTAIGIEQVAGRIQTLLTQVNIQTVSLPIIVLAQYSVANECWNLNR